MARGNTDVKVVAGEPVRFTDTANGLDRVLTTAKFTAELPDGSKGHGHSFDNDPEEARQNALFDAYAERARKDDD